MTRPWEYLVETYTDKRIAKLLIKVNAKHRGDDDDLEALFNLARRAHKKLFWRDSRGGKEGGLIEITDVLPNRPAGTNWIDIIGVYSAEGHKGPHREEKIFVLRNSVGIPEDWWTFREIVLHGHFRGFVVE